MIDEREIRQVIEEIDPEGEISNAQVEELVVAMRGLGESLNKDQTTIYGAIEETLKVQLMVETDWKKRATIAAKIISTNLE